MKRLIILFSLVCGMAFGQSNIQFIPPSWRTNGNTLSNNTSFLGTLDNRSILYRTNNTFRGVLGDSLEGRIGVGVRTPTYGVEVSLFKPSFTIAGIRSTNTSSTGFALVTARSFTTSISIFVVGPAASVGGGYSNNNCVVSCNTAGEFGMVNENATGPYGIYVGGFGAINQQLRILPGGQTNLRTNLLIGNVLTVPTATLHVIGTSSVTGSAVFNADVTASSLLVNTTTNIPSSRVTIESTTQGFLPPRMTTAQKNAIASPATGLIIYDTTLNKICVYTGSAWETVTSL